MKRDKNSGFFGGLYDRNENLLLLSAAIFLVSVLIGYFLSGTLDVYLAGVWEALKKSVSEGQLQLTTVSIFANNLRIVLLVYAGGIPLGAVTAYELFVQGLFIGYVASKNQLGNFLIFTLPHGIIEILGVIISGTAGFRLAHGILNILKGALKIKQDISIKNQLEYLLESNMDEFKDSLTLFVIAVVLILIAAFIEANLTLPWGRYVISL
jgi:stage II sporulation protein M